MKRVHVLHEKTYSSNGAAFLFPLYYHRKKLCDQGTALHFYSRIVPELTQCDVLCIGSSFFKVWWKEPGWSALASFLVKARKGVGKIIWFDIADSTGTTQFQVLPYVDLYLKNQILKDRIAYQNIYYGSRIFTDFYHRILGVEDSNPGEPHLNHIPSHEDLKKINVGWNSGFAHYGYLGAQLSKVWFRYPWLPRFYPRRWYAPEKVRSLSLSCRISTVHLRATVRASRQEIRKRLPDSILTEKISRKGYFQEMRNARAVLSPFGFGEITLRDFEAVVCGAAVMKQDMDHLETWPNLWIKGKTYLPFQWDLSDFDETIEYAKSHRKDMVERAGAAQEIYKRALISEEGHQEFCDRFERIIA